MHVELGEFRLEATGDQRTLEGQTAKKAQSVGISDIYRLDGLDVALEIGVTRWRNGDRDVRTLSRLHSPEPMERLTHGFRLGIDLESSGRYRMRLRTPKLGSRDWATPHQVSIDELDQVTGLDTRSVLLKAGADAVDLGARVPSSSTRDRNELFVLFEEQVMPNVAAIAYSIAVAIPMYRRFAAS